MQYTKVAPDGFKHIQMNAGIMVDDFKPETATLGNIMGVSSGGFQFSTNPTYTDFGEDMDNVPPNTWQLKRLTAFDPAISGTFVTITTATAKQLTGAADADSEDSSRIVPRVDLVDDDFQDVWVVGDYSDKNAGTNAGYMAIHLMNALNTAGIQWQTTDKNKGQFSFDFHGHYDITNINKVPFEIYVKAGTAASGD